MTIECEDSTYAISADGSAITCRRCGLTSHNPGDVAARFCGRCGIFHDDIRAPDLVAAAAFDCASCGRRIVVICGPVTATCGACQAVPGWFDNPELAPIIDPDNHRRPRRVLQ